MYLPSLCGHNSLPDTVVLPWSRSNTRHNVMEGDGDYVRRPPASVVGRITPRHNVVAWCDVELARIADLRAQAVQALQEGAEKRLLLPPSSTSSRR
jgi:hypothetical protein